MYTDLYAKYSKPVDPHVSIKTCLSPGSHCLVVSPNELPNCTSSFYPMVRSFGLTRKSMGSGRHGLFKTRFYWNMWIYVFRTFRGRYLLADNGKQPLFLICTCAIIGRNVHYQLAFPYSRILLEHESDPNKSSPGELYFMAPILPWFWKWDARVYITLQ